MTQKKWHYKSRRWDLFQFAYFTTNLYTSPPWQMREDRRLIFIPELWKRNKKKNSIDNLKKNWDLLPTPGLFPSFLHARGTFLPSFFVPTLGDLTTQESPPPGICYQTKKKLLTPGNQRGGGGGWGLRAAGRSWNWLMHDAIFWWFTQFQWLQFAPSEFWYWISWHISFNSSSCR